MSEKTFRQLLTSFLAGEISPLLHGRVDSQQYQLGLETCENFVPINEGPLVKRPGFEFIRPAAPTASWLSAFRFSVTQEYALEWSNGALRFFTNGGRIEADADTPYVVATPYSAAEAPRLSTAQSYDRLYIDHAAHAPARLTRTSAVTFAHDTLALANGPFADPNTDETVTVTASAATGVVTLTATSAIFRAGHVGALFRMEAKDFSDIKAWEPGMDSVVVGSTCRSDGKVYEAETADRTGTIAPTHDEGSAWDGFTGQDINAKGPYGIKWKYLHDKFGVLRITAIGGGGTTCTATVLRRLPSSLTSVASWRWAHAAFSDDAGWPSLVTLAYGRQIHIKDFDVCASVVGDYLNHRAFTGQGTIAADVAFRRRLATEDPPVWVLGDRQLLMSTASKELAVGPNNSQAAFAGDNIKSDPQSFYGTALVWPVQLGVETVFVERGGRRLRSSGYNFSSDRYVAEDLTAAARHITGSGIVQLAVQRWPFAMLHSVRKDGQIAIHPLTRSEVKGFARTVLGGGARAISAVSIIGEDGETDELWLLVERERGGSTVREIWKQSPWRELGEAQEQAFFVDGGARVFAAAGQAHFSGLDHLAGQAVAVLANGGVVPGMTVAADGTLDLPAKAVPSFSYWMVVGLPYTAQAVTLRPAIQNASGWLQGMRQRLISAVIRMVETAGLKASDPDGTPRELIDRSGSGRMDAAIGVFSGDRTVEIDGVHDREGRLRFVSADPLPAIVSMVSLKISTGDS